MCICAVCIYVSRKTAVAQFWINVEGAERVRERTDPRARICARMRLLSAGRLRGLVGIRGRGDPVEEVFVFSPVGLVCHRYKWRIGVFFLLVFRCYGSVGGL